MLNSHHLELGLRSEAKAPLLRMIIAYPRSTHVSHNLETNLSDDANTCPYHDTELALGRRCPMDAPSRLWPR